MSKENNSSNDLDVVTIRFAGDSGDGMQLTGTQFTTNTAIFGNDLATLPDFPAEIRAPAGSLFGVSSFQLQFGSREIYTPGDDVDVLVAMNPAALNVHVSELKEHGLLIINMPFSFSSPRWTFNPAGFIATSTSKSSPGVNISLLPNCN